MDPKLHPDQLYISFASAAFTLRKPSLTPQVFSLPTSREMLSTSLLGLCHGDWGKCCRNESEAYYLAERT